MHICEWNMLRTHVYTLSYISFFPILTYNLKNSSMFHLSFILLQATLYYLNLHEDFENYISLERQKIFKRNTWKLCILESEGWYVLRIDIETDLNRASREFLVYVRASKGMAYDLSWALRPQPSHCSLSCFVELHIEMTFSLQNSRMSYWYIYESRLINKAFQGLQVNFCRIYSIMWIKTITVKLGLWGERQMLTAMHLLH